MADGGILENAPVVGAKKTFPRSFGRYILEKSLSRGGMGEVFLTIAKAVWRRCVIKTIRGDLTGDEEFIGRFADEAKIMMRIQHDNIIRVFDAGKVGNDYYIAMEYMHGRDLGDVLDRAYERGEPMPTQLGLYIAEKLLNGLGYAHGLEDEKGRHMGLVHRDISPQNVLIGFDGSVKLIDFGLARTDLLPARTQGALAVGKYGYMSPEQARHERIDGRADIYSTGVMLFEVFTGDRLVDEQDQATLWQRVLAPKHRKPSTVIPELLPQIDDLVMKAVAVRAEDRFPEAESMRKFVQGLQRPESNREELVRYLRFLYPKVDFSPPPLPDYADQFKESEKSLIIATSREGAMSVFGRGELPIEWTTQIEAADLQAAFARYRERIRKDQPRGLTPSETGEQMAEVASKLDTGPVDPTWIRSTTGDEETQASLAAAVERGPVTQIVDQSQTEVSHAVEDSQNGPDTTESEIAESSEIGLGKSRVTTQFRDEERTVMMDAPPVSARSRGLLDTQTYDSTDGEAPTRLSLPLPDLGPNANPPAVGKSRSIQEKHTVRERERPNKAERAIAHRTTVPSDIADPASQKPGPETTSSMVRGRGRYFRFAGIIPGLILFGITVVILIVLALVVKA